DRLIRDRKKVEAAMRRGTAESETPSDEPMPDLATVLQRFGEEIEELLGGGGGRRKTSKEEPPPPPPPEEQRDGLDRRLPAELAREGRVVTGKDIARVVGLAVAKGIEWAG